MSTLEAAATIVSKAIVDVNAQKTDGAPLVDHPDTRLLSEDGVIDSLAFAFLVVTIEQYALDDMNKEIVLFDEQVMEMEISAADNPFRTIGSLVQFVQRKLA